MKKKGFTLVELLTVMAILGIFATTSYVFYSNSQEKARDSNRTVDLRNLRDSTNSYFLNYGVFPKSNEEADENIMIMDGKTISHIPKEPSEDRKYSYVTDGTYIEWSCDFEASGNDDREANDGENGDNGNDDTRYEVGDVPFGLNSSPSNPEAITVDYEGTIAKGGE